MNDQTTTTTTNTIPAMTMEPLAARVRLQAEHNRGGPAAKILKCALKSVLLEIIATGIAADADDETIHLALLKHAVRRPQHFQRSGWSGLNNLSAFAKYEQQNTSAAKPTKTRKRKKK